MPDSEGNRQDLTRETLANDASRAVLNRLHSSGKVSDELLRRYVNHQDHNIRFVAANKVLGINSGYIGWRSNGGKPRKELMAEFLKSEDPRVRRAMFAAIDETLRRERRSAILSKEVFDLAVKAIQSEQESWWVKDAALHVIGHAPADWVEPHVDLLLPLLKHNEWWLQNATLSALAPVVADKRCYQKVLPPIGELLRTNQRSALTLGLLGSLRDRIKKADAEVHRLAAATLRGTFTDYAGVRTAPGGQDISSTFDAHLQHIAASLADVPGGLDVLYEIARQRYPRQILPYKEYFLNADPVGFGPKLKKAIRPIITEELIPEYVGRNREKLRNLAAAEVQTGRPGGRTDPLDQLSALYQRAGQDEFGWHMFADLRNAEWSYFSFDPIASEQVPWDQLVTRYREVTLPEGMKNWYGVDFAPTNAWSKGRSPFGQYNGKLPTQAIHKCRAGCTGPGCFGGTKINSLWEKEILLMRGTFKLPPIRRGYRYRLRVNDGDHVGSGGGHIIYINGKPLIEATTCNGRGSGGSPKGAFITKEFLDVFRSGEVTIALKTFLRFNDKYKVKPSSRVPQGKISIHLEQQQLPPMGEELVRKSATVVAMLSSEWQTAQDPADRERLASAVKFRFDGKFIANPGILGEWKTVDVVPSVEDFSVGKRRNARRARFARIRFKEKGLTDDATRIWSGNMLMDLSRYEALKMQVKTLDGIEYLFIEAGGFSQRHKPDWKTSWYVLKR